MEPIIDDWHLLFAVVLKQELNYHIIIFNLLELSFANLKIID